MTEADIAELYYLVGRLIGLRTRLGHDIDQVVYYDRYRIRIEVLPGNAENVVSHETGRPDDDRS